MREREPSPSERTAQARMAVDAAVNAQVDRDRAAGLDVPESGPASSQARMNIWTEAYTPRHNRAILACPANLLGGGLAAQHAFLLKMALAPMPCPSCGRNNTKVDASGLGLDHYRIDGGEPDYRCTGCRRPLSYGLPFVGAPFWSIDHEREALEKRQGQALDADATQDAPVPRYLRHAPPPE